jgi:hypothetical protein
MKQVILLGLLLCSPAAAGDAGQIPEHPDPAIQRWFEQTKIKACCSEADGYRTDYEISSKSPSDYRVPSHDDPKVWIDVPPHAVVTDQGNPIGEAMVWWGAGNYIRCFVPPGGA